MRTENAPVNLASTICASVMGLVSNSSMVPLPISSEKLRMVMAGTRNMSTQGAQIKSASKFACPLSRTFHSPGNTQRNKPVKSRKAHTTTYPIRVLKKVRSSLRMSDFIVNFKFTLRTAIRSRFPNQPTKPKASPQIWLWFVATPLQIVLTFGSC